MSIVDECKLEEIYGGSTSITGTMINSLLNVIKVLYDAGHAFGSSARRIKENDLCSIK